MRAIDQAHRRKLLVQIRKPRTSLNPHVLDSPGTSSQSVEKIGFQPSS